MSFVIYNTITLQRKQPFYNEERVAKGALTKFVKAGKATHDEWKVAPYKEYVDADTYVTVKSLMNGAECQIRKSQVGGCCDPSMERYWTM